MDGTRGTTVTRVCQLAIELFWGYTGFKSEVQFNNIKLRCYLLNCRLIDMTTLILIHLVSA